MRDDGLEYGMATFSIHPLSRFESGSTSIRRPKEFLCFSFDEQRQLHPFSTDSLQYYYPPFIATPGTAVPPINLSSGFDSWIRADETIDHHLNGLLQTLQAHEEGLMNDGMTKLEDVKTQVDIMTWRGMLTKVRQQCGTLLAESSLSAVFRRS